MSKKPLVAIIGRPNVGKSTLFNRLIGRRLSIVNDMPGVTRDRVYADAEWCGREFVLVDTGGMEFSGNDEMSLRIKRQAEIAVDLADVIVFLVDGKAGMSNEDFDAANLLRRSRKPILLTVNKLDNFELEKSYDFYGLGVGEPIPISAEQGKGIGELLDEIVKSFKPSADEQIENQLKIAVVGKPNAGKSSLVNKLLGFERVIVSDIAGTTRDAIDTPLEINGEHYLLIDTAGIRRKRSIEKESVEQYSILRALDAIRRADVVVLVIDSSEEISEQDVRIAGLIHEAGKPSVVVMNKWDLVEKDTWTIEKFRARLAESLKFMDYFKDIFASAQTGLRVEKILELCKQSHQNASRRITTGALNELLLGALTANEPPVFAGKRLRIYYATQTAICPPTFVFFCSDAKLMHFSYLRYLENSLRKAADFSGTPIKIIARSKKGEAYD